MVITTKHLALLFVILVIFQFALSTFFTNAIYEKKEEFFTKSSSIMKLEKLKNEFSKKKQRKELKRIYDFLAMLDIQYKVKKVNQKQELVVTLPAEKAQKVINFIFNRNFNIREYEIQKLSKEQLYLKVTFS